MSERNWGFVAASIFGLIVFSASLGAMGAVLSDSRNYPEAYPPYRQSAERAEDGAPTPLLRSVQRVEQKRPCVDPQGKDESELCAQWRAANAAQDATRWAYWQLVLSGFGVAGLIVTLWFSRRALDLAREANAETRRIGEAQVRAYLSTESAELWIEAGVVMVAPVVTNSGQSPALDCICIVDVQARTGTPNEIIWNIKDKLAIKERFRMANVAAGKTNPPPAFKFENLALPQEGPFVLDVIFQYFWKDVFGKEWESDDVGLVLLIAQGQTSGSLAPTKVSLMAPTIRDKAHYQAGD